MTAHNVLRRSGIDGRQAGTRFIRNPTTGALEVGPDLRLEVFRALKREIRLLKLQLYARYAFLKLSLFCLKAMRFLENVVRKFNRSLLYVRGLRHRETLP